MRRILNRTVDRKCKSSREHLLHHRLARGEASLLLLNALRKAPLITPTTGYLTSPSQNKKVAQVLCTLKQREKDYICMNTLCDNLRLLLHPWAGAGRGFAPEPQGEDWYFRTWYCSTAVNCEFKDMAPLFQV